MDEKPSTLQETLNMIEEATKEYRGRITLRRKNHKSGKYDLEVEINELDAVEEVEKLVEGLVTDNEFVYLRSVGASISSRDYEEYLVKMNFVKGASLFSRKLTEIMSLPNTPTDLNRLLIGIGAAGLSIQFGTVSGRNLEIERHQQAGLELQRLSSSGDNMWWIEPMLKHSAGIEFSTWQSNANRTFDWYLRNSSREGSALIEHWTEQWYATIAREAFRRNQDGMAGLKAGNKDFIYWISPVDRPEHEMFYYTIQTMGIEEGLQHFNNLLPKDG